MKSGDFFEDPSEQSRVKAAIVSKYFDAWAKVMKPRARSGRIAYFDLFAGPGRYDTGEPSTPVLILRKALADAELRDMLVTVFNDRNADHIDSLKRVVDEIPGIGALKHEPSFDSAEIGEGDAEFFESFSSIPSLFFLDPWGYKGLSLRLINAVIGSWGCDCIFFFNYNRINPGLSNPMVKEHMRALFGERQADALSQELAGLDAKDREAYIMEALCNALGAKQGRYVLPFGFRNDEGTRTSHHLIFVSKSVRGYTIPRLYHYEGHHVEGEFNPQSGSRDLPVQPGGQPISGAVRAPAPSGRSGGAASARFYRQDSPHARNLRTAPCWATVRELELQGDTEEDGDESFDTVQSQRRRAPQEHAGRRRRSHVSAAGRVSWRSQALSGRK
jgi:three-Cys-motif partner protein